MIKSSYFWSIVAIALRFKLFAHYGTKFGSTIVKNLLNTVSFLRIINSQKIPNKTYFDIESFDLSTQEPNVYFYTIWINAMTRTLTQAIPLSQLPTQRNIYTDFSSIVLLLSRGTCPDNICMHRA
jgi:hypothetical protein